MRGRGRIVALLAGPALAGAFTPAAASADVITLDHGAARVPSIGRTIPIVTPADPLEINNVTYGPGDEFASSAAADFDFSPYSGTVDGISFTIDIAPVSAVTGTFDPTTGVMTTEPVGYTTTVTIGPPDNATCSYTVPFAFSTENTAVIAGDRFDAAGAPPVNGAVAATWASVPADPAPGCVRLNGFADRAGAFWLSNGIEPPALGHKGPPPVCPKKKGKAAKAKCARCKKGRVMKKRKCVKKKRKRAPARRPGSRGP